MIGLLPAAALWAALAQGARPPEVEAAVVPETVTVGARFTLLVWVRTPPGTRVVFPDTLEVSEAVAGVTPVEVRRSGDTLWRAEYEVVAWAPGRHDLPALAVRARAPDGEPVALEAPRPAVVVASVLPAGVGPVAPRGPKGVWGANWAWWEVAGAALASALALGALVWGWRRLGRRPRPLPRVTSDPKAVALAALDTLQAQGVGWLIRGDAKTYYTQLSQVLRYYLQAVEARWGPERTTTELLVRLRSDGVTSYDAFELGDILGEADLVKFAPVRPLPRDAVALTERARQWLREFRPPAPEPEPEPEPAAEAAGVAAAEAE